MEQRPEFDREFANALIGKHVLVGLTYLNEAGDAEERLQVHGFVVRCDESLVEIEPWGGGEPMTLPPDLRPFTPAPSGEYRLRSTGEVVVDPDFTASWTVRHPPAR